MPDYDPKTDIHVTPGPPSAGGGLYFIVGALVVAVLVGAYFMLGAPGLHSNVARAPDANVTVEQPSAPAQPAPATPAPAPQRQQ
ncbi:MAG: hypothetical protein GEV13_25440 [Rhodospirillales bacterium]|nr:hypothetical protein [Rhodospirillales bacterium]